MTMQPSDTEGGEGAAGEAVRRLSVWRHEAGRGWADHDELIVEAPVALVFNGISHAVMMATPQDLEDLALGFALSEGVIDSRSQCRDIEVAHHGGRGFEVRLEIASSAFAGLKLRRRSLEGRTGCGLCGLESLEQLDLYALPRRSMPAVPLAAEVILRAFQALPGLQPLNARTGACHAAGWARPDGCLAQVREDVGRHNALDKLLGRRALAGESNADGFAIVSSRASVELVRKCARLGVGALAAISAPTSLAVETASAVGMQLYGYCRGEQVVRYTGD